MGEFRMPSLGADMEAGTLVEWRVKPGDTVKRGDIVALVETQKGLVEVEIWEGGVVEALLAAPRTRVPVGTALATIRAIAPTPSEELRAPVPKVAPTPHEGAPLARAPIAPAAREETPRIHASPAARQLARERGIDLATIRGTGPHGTITHDDVQRATSNAPPSRPAATTRLPATEHATGEMRRAIAAAMSRSKREIPHYYLGLDIDVNRATAWLEAENGKRSVPERILFAALLLKATALAVREVPDLNGFFVDGAFRPSEAVHVGVAVTLRQGGLIAPAIHDVDKKTLGEVMGNLRDLVARTRAGTLRSSEMTDPTITVTNLGDQGVTTVFGVIYPPQVALVGFGRVVERPWAENGMLGVRPVVTATLAADHRASDGHRGALLLAAIERRLNHPEEL